MTERDRKLASAIGVRHTDRLPFSAVTEWQSIEAVVAGSVNRQAVHLEALADELHPRLEEAAQIAESLRFYDTPYHNELHWWTAPFEASEGIPYSALVSAAEGDRVGVGRVFPVPRRPERRLEVPEDHAKILLLSTDHNTRADAHTTAPTVRSSTTQGLTEQRWAIRPQHNCRSSSVLTARKQRSGPRNGPSMKLSVERSHCD